MLDAYAKGSELVSTLIFFILHEEFGKKKQKERMHCLIILQLSAKKTDIECTHIPQQSKQNGRKGTACISKVHSHMYNSAPCC
jgi:hypothetical protein